ncbi:MAG TPA: S4 domain-containing protein [Steroidobacteraceae bacterium]|nr:S4 domain-containing protein [Steroidobacteraceae bacterium]
MPQEPAQRLQKALAHLGLGSRREIETWIRAGRLTVNGKLAELGTRVRESDRIRLDGRLVRQRPAASHQVFLCHRSPGEPLDAAALRRSSTAPEPAESARTPDADLAQPDDEPATRNLPHSARAPRLEALIDRLPRSGGRRFIPISPMPRQDGGLELVSSDGELAERLQRAVRGLTGEFSVRLHGALDEPQLASVRSGELDGGERLAVLDLEARGGEGTNHWYALTARGASGRAVRQLFERSGGTVSRVLRTRLGTVALDRSLSRGRFRKLAQGELDQLLGREGESAPRHRRATARRSSGR